MSKVEELVRGSSVVVERLFQWVEWALVIAAVRYVHVTQKSQVAGIVFSVLVALLSLHMSSVYWTAFPPKRLRSSASMGFYFLLAGAAGGLISWGLSELIEAVAVSPR